MRTNPQELIDDLIADGYSKSEAIRFVKETIARRNAYKYRPDPDKPKEDMVLRWNWRKE